MLALLMMQMSVRDRLTRLRDRYGLLICGVGMLIGAILAARTAPGPIVYTIVEFLIAMFFIVAGLAGAIAPLERIAGDERGGLTMAQAMVSIAIAIALVTVIVGANSFVVGNAQNTNQRVESGFTAHNALMRTLAATMYDSAGTVRAGMKANATWSLATSPAPSATPVPAASIAATWNGTRISVDAEQQKMHAQMGAAVQPVALPPGTTVDTTE